VLTGFTYNITGPDGQANVAQTCREGSDTWNTTKSVTPEVPFDEVVDFTAPNCFPFKLTEPGHYRIQVDFERPVCSPPAPNGCRIDEEHGEFSLLRIKSNTVDFDVLPQYTAENSAPSETMAPSMADTEIQRWLNSGNPRMAAWAAYFILRDHPAGGVGDMQSWLESMLANDRLPPTVWNMNTLETERSHAAHVVLDTLIQSHAELSTVQIRTIAANDPVLALILAMRPKWNETAVLNVFDLVGGIKFDIHRGNADPGYNAILNARYFAGEALAASGSRDFLGKLRAEFIVKIDFKVLPAKDKDSCCSGFSGPIIGCGGGWIARGGSVPGWPQAGNYGLSEGIPKQLFDETAEQHAVFDFTNSVPLGQGDLRYTRLVSQNYGAAAFAPSGCRDDLHWIELYGHHGERLETKTTFYVTDDEDYHDQLRKWVAGLGATYALILSDAGVPPTPLKVRLDGLDFMHPEPGSNVGEAGPFNFAGFPPAGVTVVSR